MSSNMPQTQIVTTAAVGCIPAKTYIEALIQRYPSISYIALRPAKYGGTHLTQSQAVRVVTAKQLLEMVATHTGQRLSDRMVNKLIKTRPEFRGARWKVTGRGTRGGAGGTWYVSEAAANTFVRSRQVDN